MIDNEVSLGHEFFQIPEAESKPKIPADTQEDDLGLKMAPFKQCGSASLHEPQAYQIASTSFATLPSHSNGYRQIDPNQQLCFSQPE